MWWRAIDRLMVDHFLESYGKAPLESYSMRMLQTIRCTAIKKDGSTQYCYLPLYIFCGEFLLYARLKSQY